MPIKIISPRNNKDLEECVIMYSRQNDDSFLEIDFKRCLFEIEAHWKLRKFLKLAIDDSGNIIAWLMADMTTQLHLREWIYQMLYFSCTATGSRAALVVKKLFNELIKDAEKNKIPIVWTTSLYLDSKQNLVKILEHYGWIRRDYVAIWKTSHYSSMYQRRPDTRQVTRLY